jgi:hypothetical protein
MSLALPYPENPEHTDNLASIALMELAGFTGNDASLSESLFEYGLAWRELETEFLFVYRHPSLPNRFDRCTIAKSTIASKEWNWAFTPDHATGFFSFLDEDSESWNSLPLVRQVSDLVSYWGTEEVFGTSYWQGFAIAKE